MASYAASRKTGHFFTTGQLVRGFIVANLLLGAFAVLGWIVVQQYNSATSPDIVSPPPRSLERPSGNGRHTGKHVVLPNSLANYTEVSPGETSRVSIAQSEFSTALGRLDRALDARKGVEREALVAAVNRQSPAERETCAVSWNDGEPVLRIPASDTGKISLSATLNRCAEAVEKLP